MTTALRCSWCDEALAADHGWRAYEPARDRAAAFCRLEHVVPWAIRGPAWADGSMPPLEHEPGACSRCDAPLGDVRFVLVRHRGEHRIPDAFCSAEHMRAWAGAGGRYG